MYYVQYGFIYASSKPWAFFNYSRPVLLWQLFLDRKTFFAEKSFPQHIYETVKNLFSSFLKFCLNREFRNPPSKGTHIATCFIILTNEFNISKTIGEILCYILLFTLKISECGIISVSKWPPNIFFF